MLKRRFTLKKRKLKVETRISKLRQLAAFVDRTAAQDTYLSCVAGSPNAAGPVTKGERCLWLPKPETAGLRNAGSVVMAGVAFRKS